MRRVRGLAWAVGLVVSTAASAALPVLDFTPAAQPLADLSTPTSGASPIVVGPFGAAISVSAAGVPSGFEFTSLTCSLTGDDAFTVQPSQLRFTVDDQATPRSLEISCAAVARELRGTLRCAELRKGATQQVLYWGWDLSCPATGVAEWNAVPAAGAPITLAADVGTPSSSTVVVSNSGTTPLDVLPSGIAGSLSVAPPGTSTIAPNGSRTYTITCTPTTGGTSNQQLSFSTNDTDEAVNVYPVSCTGRVPVLSTSPQAPGNFSIATTQPATGSQQLTIANTGTAALSWSIAGLPSPFSASPPNGSVPAGGSQPVSIDCSGANAGTFTAPSIVVTTNDPVRPSTTFNAQCTVATAASAIYRSVPPPPGPLSLSTTVGNSASQTLVVWNDGTGALQVTGFSGLSAPLSIAPAADSVPPGQSRSFTLTCNGAAPGVFPRTLVVATNAGNRSYDVDCQVVATTAPEFASVPAAPGPIAITTVQNVAASRPLQLRNAGTASLTVSYAQPGGAFSVSPAGPFTLAPNATQDVTVTCQSATVGAPATTLVFATNDADEASVSFNLSCTVGANAPEFREVAPEI